MGKLLHNRRLVRWRPDRIAVRVHYAHCDKADRTGHRASQQRLHDAERRPFRGRAAIISDCKRSVGRYYNCIGSLGFFGPLRGSVRLRCGPAYAPAERLSACVRGLAVSCPASIYGIRGYGHLGRRGPLPSATGPFFSRCGGAAVALCRHSQRLGCRHLLCLCQIEAGGVVCGSEFWVQLCRMGCAHHLIKAVPMKGGGRSPPYLTYKLIQ